MKNLERDTNKPPRGTKTSEAQETGRLSICRNGRLGRVAGNWGQPEREHLLETLKETEVYTKAMIRKVLAPSTDALTVVQFCAEIDPDNWAERARKMENNEARTLHSEWLGLAEYTLKKMLDN